MRLLNKKIFYVSAALCIFLSPMSAPALTLEFANPSRDLNSLDQRLGMDSKGRARFNKQDCAEKESLHFNFKITMDSSDLSGKFGVILYAGSNCEDRSNCTVFELSRKETQVRQLTISELFGPGFECTGTGEINVWAARATDWDELWFNWDFETEPLVIAYDLEEPDAPTLVSALGGQEKVRVTWSNTSVADSVYILYYPGSHTTAPGQTTDDESSDDFSTEPDDGGISDAGDLWDAGLSASPLRMTPMTATADATKDTESATCPTPDGGFEAGDSFDVNASASDYGYKTYTGKKETEVTGLKNGQPYKLGAVAQDSFNNYSKVSNTLCATPGVTRNFWDDYTDSGGKGGKFCFIATAAFGSYDHPVVQLLRRFRDHFLEAIPGGEHLVAAYYRVGPSAAAVVEDRPALRGLTVGVLTLAAGLSLPLSLLGPLGTLGLALAAFGTLFIRRRIRLHRSK